MKAWAIVAAASGGSLIALGAAMPWIATNLVHDPTPRAQQEVDARAIGFLGATFNAGTHISAYGYVANVTNLTDLDFIPDNLPTKVAVLSLDGLDALVVFENKLNLRAGEVAVADGYLYRLQINNTSFAVVIGASAGQLAWAALTGDVTGVLDPAQVFRPWWDGVGLAIALSGASLLAGAAFLEWNRRQPPLPPAELAAAEAVPRPSLPPPPR